MRICRYVESVDARGNPLYKADGISVITIAPDALGTILIGSGIINNKENI